MICRLLEKSYVYGSVCLGFCGREMGGKGLAADSRKQARSLIQVLLKTVMPRSHVDPTLESYNREVGHQRWKDWVSWPTQGIRCWLSSSIYPSVLVFLQILTVNLCFWCDMISLTFTSEPQPWCTMEPSPRCFLKGTNASAPCLRDSDLRGRERCHALAIP